MSAHDTTRLAIRQVLGASTWIGYARGITPRKTIGVLIATFRIENGYALIHNDWDFDPMARAVARRVVVKRPKGAPWLTAAKPSHAIDMPNSRFDVYLHPPG